MKIAFWLGLVLGLAAVLAASHFYPWVAHARLPSKTTVVANGGRAEQFLIRLPADRISTGGSEAGGLRGTPEFATMALPAVLADAPLLIEHFKVRDSAGNVIGLAVRHWSVVDATAGTAWLVVVPSRGSLLLVAPGEPAAAVDSALSRAGYSTGKAWDGEVQVELASDERNVGTVIGGSKEFDGMRGRYTENWNVTGVSESGELRGTIELDTVTFHDQ